MTDFYIDRSNILQNKYREEYLERHKKRLDEISKRKAKKNTASLESDISVRLNNNKRQIHELNQHNQKEAIDKSNQLLLRKLVEIQAGKRSILPKSHSHSQLVTDFRAKSLHISRRKIELERIEKENLKIAQKIYELKPHLQISEFEQEFENHKKYASSIRKLYKKKLPISNGKHGVLPPLGTASADENNDEEDNEQHDRSQLKEVSQSMDDAMLQQMKELSKTQDNSTERDLRESVILLEESKDGKHDGAGTHGVKKDKTEKKLQILQYKAASKDTLKLYTKKTSPKRDKKNVKNGDIESALKEKKEEKPLQQPVGLTQDEPQADIETEQPE